MLFTLTILSAITGKNHFVTLDTAVDVLHSNGINIEAAGHVFGSVGQQMIIHLRTHEDRTRALKLLGDAGFRVKTGPPTKKYSGL